MAAFYDVWEIFVAPLRRKVVRVTGPAFMSAKLVRKPIDDFSG